MYESPRFELGGEAAARHAQAQYAVSRVLVRASDTDEAFRDLLPAIAAAKRASKAHGKTKAVVDKHPAKRGPSRV